MSININKKYLLIIGAIIVLLAVIGGGYYWWTGTAQYSVLKLKKAIESHNVELALKYIDVDSIFDNLWSRFTSQTLQEGISSQNEWEIFGTILGMGLAESIKPAIKEQLKQSIIDSIKDSSEEMESESDASTEFKSIWEEKFKIKKTNGSAYIEPSENIKIVLTKTPDRYWRITDIQGLEDMITETEPSESVEDIQIEESEPNKEEKESDQSQTSQPSQPQKKTPSSASFGERVELIVEGVADRIFLTVSRPENYISDNEFLQPDSGKKFIAVLIRYENESDQPITYNQFRFSIVDPLSARYEPYLALKEPALGSGTLNPAKSVQGYITFEVPQSITLSDFSVHYETDLGLSIDFE